MTGSAELRAVRRDALRIGLAAGAYAVSFGAISVASGLSVLQTCVLSLLMFTGASQFAFVGVVGAGGRTRPASRPRCCSAPGTPCTACGWRRSYGPAVRGDC